MASIEIELTPKQSLFDQTIERTRHTFFGGARGGGKSHGIREIMLKRRIQYPNTSGAIFRKTWEEVRDNHLNPLLEKFSALKPFYVAGEKGIFLPNGSKLLFRHVKDFEAMKKKQGLEFNDLAIDELGDWEEDWYLFLKASNRSSTKNYQPRFFGSGNPGGRAHKWLKRLFVERRFKYNENPKDYAFVPSKTQDNPALDREYMSTLESISDPILRKAWIEGSWDIEAGQFFDMLRREKHMVDDFEIPDYWYRMAMLDKGYNHPCAIQWLTTDSDGNHYVYRDYLERGKRPEEIAEYFMSFEDSKKLAYVIAGPDCWNKVDGAPSFQEKFEEACNYQITLVKANTDRVARAEQVRDYLAIREGENETKPRLQFFKSCHKTFDCLLRMTHDPKRPEDVLKVDATQNDVESGDDLYDSFGMGLMDRPRITAKKDDKLKTKKYSKDDYQGSWTTV